MAVVAKPGKIVAVHVSYRSRAAERGILPPWPSYFLKPSSSLAESGDPVVRPPGPSPPKASTASRGSCTTASWRLPPRSRPA
jgi:2-keto-4-pentenoate hydratase/2-oxohepta-3-ene-1,7-dioic acid hydratase in catechol pathway